jgi:integrase
MGSRKWPTGIVPREKSIEIRLNLNDKRRYVNISWLPTPSNIRKAGQIRKNAQEAIKWGQFSWREFFPDSKYAEEESNDKTFGHYAAIYLKTLVCAESTQEKYQESLDRFYLSSLSNRVISHIKYTELLSLLANFSWGSNKSRNNALIPLRAVFKLAQRDGAITHNPCEGIENGKHQSPEADPMNVEEMEIFLDWIRKTQHPMWVNYFEYTFFSGLRPSEQIALTWSSVDFNRGYVRVEKSKVRGLLRQHTKTYKVRDVEFNTRAKQALKRQKEWTFLQGNEVFVHPSTGQPFTNNASVRLMWNKGLKACGIRHRSSYQTRHTFCTNCLQSGAKIHWVSKQLGHASAMMTLNRYSKWIEQANAEKESFKLDLFVSSQIINNEQKGAKMGF